MNVSYQRDRWNDLVVDFVDKTDDAVMAKQEEHPCHVIGDHVERLHALRESWIQSNLST